MSSTVLLDGYSPEDSKYDSIKFAIQSTYDYFDYFWRGEGRRWNMSERKSHFVNFAVPKTRIRPPRGSRPGREQPARPYRRYGKIALRQERPKALAEVEEQVQQGYFPVKAALDPLDISISKILGWGGQAVAVLVELLGEGGQREKMVIKCHKPTRSDLASEIAHMNVSSPLSINLYDAVGILDLSDYRNSDFLVQDISLGRETMYLNDSKIHRMMLIGQVRFKPVCCLKMGSH